MQTRKRATAAQAIAHEVAPTVLPRRTRAQAKPVTVSRPQIDLADPNASKQLRAAYPAPLTDRIREATADEAQHVADYLDARDRELEASGEKERAGNGIRAAIAEDLGIRGDGWIATWARAEGRIDWERLARDLGITAEQKEKYRGEPERRISVRETKEVV